ncbi:MAG TPA: dethiobiotin synthase [Leucothrix mucor]|uniref:ATP-dependent dethiobiotin synthetase BioD n=1 Tax=Leucothrix mucor TaxID=45248 RepID=A0A7V2WVU7_LEUMU|nr:dethiobiotin synthase [Leucothrix mucor]
MPLNNKVLQNLLKTLDLNKGIFMTGTDTDVGKTWVGCQIIKALRQQGYNITPRKPVESGWNDDVTQTDAWKLANAANKQHQLNVTCPNRFKTAVSPSRAAQLEGQKISLAALKQQCLNKVDSEQILYVEGAGGFYSPLCQDGLNADLCVALDLPVILVAEDKLGCINHVLLSVEAIKKRGLLLSCIVLNQRQITEVETQQNNAQDLKNYLPDEIIISVE